MTKKNLPAPVDTDIARKIWLAGVGAYGRVLGETQNAVGKLAGSANETFDQLVARGEEIEDAVRARIAQSGASERVVSLVDSVSKQAKAQREALEDRIGAVRKTVVDVLSPYSIVSLSKAVEKLSDRVETLQAEVAKLKATKSAPKRPAGRKNAA
ncbi:MAG TPA: phasin family protein [Rhizomicrobium sp.]|jgi:poly(hydroxyalkanoate) granule-associated protein